MLQSESNPDKIFDLKRQFAQSGRLSMNFNVHMGNLGLRLIPEPLIFLSC